MNDGIGTSLLDWTFDDFQSEESLVFHTEIARLTPVDDPFLWIDNRYALVPDDGH